MIIFWGGELKGCGFWDLGRIEVVVVIVVDPVLFVLL